MDTSMASSGRGRRSTPAEAAAEIRYGAHSMPVSLVPRSLSVPVLSTPHINPYAFSMIHQVYVYQP
jgi:hypothetical protein